MIYYYQYKKEKMAADWEAAILRMHKELQQESGRAAKQEKRMEHILAWSLLAEALQREYGISSLEQLDICRTEKGKPYSRAYPEIQFNVSHCDTACACILSSQKAGVDIERKFSYRNPLAKRVCSQEEWDYMCSRPEDGEQREDFLRILWSVKESIVKCEGTGLGYGMNRLNVMPLFQKERAKHDKAWKGILPTEDMGILEVQVLLEEQFTLASCSQEKDLELIRVEDLKLQFSHAQE